MLAKNKIVKRGLHDFFRLFLFTSFGKCLMLLTMLPLHKGHSGDGEVASSSRIHALHSLSLHLHIGTGDKSGLFTSVSKPFNTSRLL